MILVDTSAWVEFIRATGSPVHARLAGLVDADAAIATTDAVAMEVLAGARAPAEERRLRSLLAYSVFLPLEAGVDFENAALIYRRCRGRGITPRDLIDCMIASVAMRYGAVVLAHDIDFARIASVVALDLDPATPTA